MSRMPSISASPSDVTALLHAWSAGDPDASDRLFNVIYAELHRLAESQLRRSPYPVTMQATELIHEAYVRLSARHGTPWADRGHFYALSATVIRRVLLDHARYTLAERRDRRREVGLECANGASVMTESRADELIQLSAALDVLAEEAPRRARVVELRYFGGLTNPEVAELLGVSLITVKRDWAFARAWLRCRITAGDRGDV